jgi:hypothetical protein
MHSNLTYTNVPSLNDIYHPHQIYPRAVPCATHPCYMDSQSTCLILTLWKFKAVRRSTCSGSHGLRAPEPKARTSNPTLSATSSENRIEGNGSLADAVSYSGIWLAIFISDTIQKWLDRLGSVNGCRAVCTRISDGAPAGVVKTHA